MAQQKIQSVQLSDSGVVPGPYTSADVTVDAAGRITAISNGIGGGGTVTSVSVDGTVGRVTSSGSPITYEGTGYYPQAGINFLVGATLKF